MGLVHIKLFYLLISVEVVLMVEKGGGKGIVIGQEAVGDISDELTRA